MKKSEKMKEPTIVRGFSDDEPYEYAEGGGVGDKKNNYDAYYTNKSIDYVEGEIAHTERSARNFRREGNLAEAEDRDNHAKKLWEIYYKKRKETKYAKGSTVKGGVEEWSIVTKNEEEHFDNYADARDFWNGLSKLEKANGQFFRKVWVNGEEGEVEILGGKLYAKGSTIKGGFKLGDKVKVVRGANKGEKGVVSNTDSDFFGDYTIDVRGHKLFGFKADDLIKYAKGSTISSSIKKGDFISVNKGISGFKDSPYYSNKKFEVVNVEKHPSDKGRFIVEYINSKGNIEKNHIDNVDKVEEYAADGGMMAKGGKIDYSKQTANDFKLGEIVWDIDNKRYGTIIGIYDDYASSKYEVRLDTDGMQPTENLRKVGSKGDKGTKEKLGEEIKLYKRLIKNYPYNNYPQQIKKYEVGGMMAKGGLLGGFNYSIGGL